MAQPAHIRCSHTNKSKHKQSRKRAAGRKGTVDEYDYLISSIGRLVIRVDEKSGKPLHTPIESALSDLDPSFSRRPHPPSTFSSRFAGTPTTRFRSPIDRYKLTIVPLRFNLRSVARQGTYIGGRVGKWRNGIGW
jgi:hypothetical protein